MSCDPAEGFSIFVSLTRDLTRTGRTELEDELLMLLPENHFRFRRGELLLRDITAADLALPILGDLVDGVWSSSGKDLLDNYVPVSRTHHMKCPACSLDRELDVAALVDVRLIRSGVSIDDARVTAIRWDENSPCSCSCGWSGTVADARE